MSEYYWYHKHDIRGNSDCNIQLAALIHIYIRFHLWGNNGCEGHRAFKELSWKLNPVFVMHSDCFCHGENRDEPEECVGDLPQRDIYTNDSKTEALIWRLCTLDLRGEFSLWPYKNAWRKGQRSKICRFLQFSPLPHRRYIVPSTGQATRFWPTGNEHQIRSTISQPATDLRVVLWKWLTKSVLISTSKRTLSSRPFA